MRVLILTDESRDLAGEVRFQDDDGFVKASPRRDLATYVPCLDQDRVQVEVCALHGSGERSLHERGWLDLSAWRRLFGLARAHQIELIHAMGLRATLYTMAIGRVLGIPTMATFHEPPNIHAQDKIVGWGLRLTRWGINRVILPFEYFKLPLLNMHYPPGQIEVVYPSVDVPEAIPSAPERAALGLPDGPLVTMVAPLTATQGFEVVLDAFSRAAQRIPEIHMAIVGKGPQLTELRWQAARIHAPVLWLGERADMQAIIQASDVIVAYARREGLPLSLVYAAAAGKPAVATRVSGVNEVVEPAKTGSLITPGDARDLALQIGRYLLQPTWAKQMGEAAFALAQERFSRATQCQAMTALYEATIYASR